MSFQDFWKKAKKATALGIESVRTTQFEESENPLKDGDFISSSNKFRKTSQLVYDTLKNFQELANNMSVVSSYQNALAKCFTENVKISESTRFEANASSFQRTVASLVEDIKSNTDLQTLSSKRAEIQRLSRIQEKLQNNLLLKNRAEEKVTKLIAKGTPERRQAAQAEFDKRYENVNKYNRDFQVGVDDLYSEVKALIIQLAIFYNVISEQYIEAAKTEFVPETASLGIFMGSDTSDGCDHNIIADSPQE
ncbi:hypothetical protein TRFO_03242 [Tritrichomonas foetus]|uniref:BAR domain-containing protein n=1 Tax=Tritrichomonas foetus TaxID=1144522 RepID=A0A1J4KSD6_9EUKA|nr:hypothetical protein TRFO_03242 [Tritrichomonas foetus]|eukprot:OHT14171.1 hypothetical protein TRFO_03242 [Tritrichomonas foetus]